MNKLRVAINGAGRIGRAFYKVAAKRDDMEVVALNDLGDIHNLAYLLKYDSAYGRSGLDVSVGDDGASLVIDGRTVKYLSEKEPAKLPWGELCVDVVVESTGFFTSFEGARGHIAAGAKRVVISAPAKGDPKDQTEGTILMGLNEADLASCEISSNASCTTNAASPLIQILHEAIGIEKALLSTTHAYTASQSIVDGPNKKDFKEGRAGAHNIVPTTTGAAKAVTKVVKDLDGLFDGISLRVPVIAGSIADVTFIGKRDTTAEEVNDILRRAALEDRWKKTFTVTDEPLVSGDIVGSLYAAIADLNFTRVVGGNLVKVLSWYDNEMGYTYSLVEHVAETGKHIKKYE